MNYCRIKSRTNCIIAKSSVNLYSKNRGEELLWYSLSNLKKYLIDIGSSDKS